MPKHIITGAHTVNNCYIKNIFHFVFPLVYKQKKVEVLFWVSQPLINYSDIGLRLDM